MSGQLQLQAGQPRLLAYGQGIRRDLRLLEVADEEMLEELLDGRCAKAAAISV